MPPRACFDAAHPGPGPPPGPFPHTLPEQVLPPPLHMTPQPPQFALSLVVSTHTPAQRVKPALQAVPQPLLVHVAVPLGTLGQLMPQAPQFLVSLLVSTQTAPQRM